MNHSPEILKLAVRQNLVPDQLVLLHEKHQQIPGSVQYTIERYFRDVQWNIEDTGMIEYHFEKSSPRENFLELKFCVSGNVYCRKKDTECDMCQYSASKNCMERVDSVDLVIFRFSPVQLSQFVKPRRATDSLTDDILNFKYASSFSKTVPLCGKTRMVLEALLNHSYTDSLENIFINAQTQMLLLYSLDCMLGEKEIDVVNCKFLANELDREKIIKAREVLIRHIGEPITIKELSRKVAINECYLKKGFNGGWKGKVFHAAQNSGINILEDEEHKEHEKYPFQTYKAKGLQDQEKEVLCLDYSSKQNPWWVRPILDEVVQVEPGKYLGKMHVRVIPGFPFTVLFFRLEKPVS